MQASSTTLGEGKLPGTSFILIEQDHLAGLSLFLGRGAVSAISKITISSNESRCKQKVS